MEGEVRDSSEGQTGTGSLESYERQKCEQGVKSGIKSSIILPTVLCTVDVNVECSTPVKQWE